MFFSEIFAGLYNNALQVFDPAVDGLGRWPELAARCAYPELNILPAELIQQQAKLLQDTIAGYDRGSFHCFRVVESDSSPIGYALGSLVHNSPEWGLLNALGCEDRQYYLSLLAGELQGDILGNPPIEQYGLRTLLHGICEQQYCRAGHSIIVRSPESFKLRQALADLKFIRLGEFNTCHNSLAREKRVSFLYLPPREH